MSGASIEVEGLDALDIVERRLVLLDKADRESLLEGMGALVESQTRRRLQKEKQAPDGSEWPDWSEEYAASQHGAKVHKPHPGQRRSAGGHSMLQLSGALTDSIQYSIDGDTISVGSNLEYAATHQYGFGGVPAREFLGMSAANEKELRDFVVDFVAEASK